MDGRLGMDLGLHKISTLHNSHVMVRIILTIDSYLLRSSS